MKSPKTVTGSTRRSNQQDGGPVSPARGGDGPGMGTANQALQLVAEFVRGPQRKPTIVVLSSTILLVTWRYVFYFDRFEDPARGAVYAFLSFFVLAGVVPALIVKLVFRERLADYGVGFGVPSRTIRSFLVMLPVILVIAYMGSHNPTIRSFYPLNPSAGDSLASFGFHLLTFGFFYLGWEFHFRGFLQHGLKDSMGPANSILVQVMATTLVHIGNPGIEVFGCILVGLGWGFLAYHTRSLLSGLMQHALLGMTTDFLIAFG